jgi:dihydrolipoamide dehydrogenase
MGYDYDLIVIGAGPGGYVAAIRAAQLGARVALGEKEALGGTCLNKGCIPTKCWLASTQKLDMMKNAASFGLSAENIGFDLAKIRKRKNDTVNRLRNGVNFLLRKNGVKVHKGQAVFLDDHTVSVGEGRLSAAQFIIASGSLPQGLPFAHTCDLLVDSDQMLELEQVPPHLTILGGGAIGIEFASIWHSLGSRVTIIEMAQRILPFIDADIAACFTQILQKRGLDIICGAKVEKIAQGGKTATVLLKTADGHSQQIESDLILAATGRRPYVEDLGLDKVGIIYDQKGIKVDEHFITNKAHIAAIGDVIGGVQLAHVASAQGIAAAEHLCGTKAEGNLQIIPSCIYTEPEIACVGLDEEEAKKQGIAYETVFFPLAACGKAVLMEASEGLVKLLRGEDGKLLGLHILAPHASDMIGEAALALSANLPVTALANTIHPHPSIVESLMEAAHLAEGKPIHIIK